MGPVFDLPIRYRPNLFSALHFESIPGFLNALAGMTELRKGHLQSDAVTHGCGKNLKHSNVRDGSGVSGVDNFLPELMDDELNLPANENI